MDKEKVRKLLESTILEDVLLGIELSYKLPIDEFISIFNDLRPLKTRFPGFIKFHRGGETYIGGYDVLMRARREVVNDEFKDITPII